MQAGRGYIATMEVLNTDYGRGFYVLVGDTSGPSGGVWFPDSDSGVWQAFGPEDSAFRVWLFAN